MNRIVKICIRLVQILKIPICIARFFFKAFGFSVLQITTYHNAEKIKILAENTKSFSFLPDEDKNIQKKIETIFPAIYALKLKNAIINGHQFAVCAQGKIFIPNYYYENIPRINCSGGNFFILREKLGVIRDRPLARHSHGIGLIGLGSFNWYHWLIEILPTAMLADRLPDEYSKFPFFVPSEYNKYGTFRDSIDSLKLNRKIIPLLGDKSYFVKKMIMIDIPVHGPFNLAKGNWPKISDYKQNENLLHQYRLHIMKNLEIKEHEPIKKIFLSRGNNRRNYNQHELEQIARKFGFNIVLPELLSFRDQVALFNSAKYVIGASGAAWTNLLFCQRNSFGLTWIFPEYRGFCAYSNLAAIVGMKLKYFYTYPGKKLKSTGEAYSMSYQIDPNYFSEKIKLLLNEVSR